MARFLVRVGQRRPANAGRAGFGLWGPWLLLLAVLGTVAWIIPARFALNGIRVTPLTPTYLWAAVWPILAGVIGLGALLALSRRWPWPAPAWVAPGDLLVFAERAARAAAAFARNHLPLLAAATGRRIATLTVHTPATAAELALRRGETAIGRFAPAGILMLVGIAVLFVALTWG
jgi:hydrogenase/urease accessory protein HupE